MHKIDIPAFPWPVAPFPSLKYPLKQYEQENAAEEKRCLDAVEQIFSSRANNADAVAGCIVEPILAEGGDKSASHDFFRKLRALCSKCAFDSKIHICDAHVIIQTLQVRCRVHCR